MLHRKMYKNLRSVMAILVLLNNFSDQFGLNLLPLIMTFSPNAGMMHFVRTFSIHAWLKRKNYCHRRGLKLWKNTVFIKNIVENGW